MKKEKDSCEGISNVIISDDGLGYIFASRDSERIPSVLRLANSEITEHSSLVTFTA